MAAVTPLSQTERKQERLACIGSPIVVIIHTPLRYETAADSTFINCESRVRYCGVIGKLFQSLLTLHLACSLVYIVKLKC